MPKQNGVLYLKLEGVLVDNESFYSERPEISFGKVYQVLKKAADDEAITDLFIKFDRHFYVGEAHAHDLIVLLKNFKAKGKKIVCYADHYHAFTYAIASVADQIILPREGSFSFNGFHVGSVYCKDFFDKIGIRYDTIRVGEYKSAVEPYISNKMSLENRQQLTEYLEGVNKFYIQTLAENRNIPFDVVAENLKTILFHSTDTLKENKFITDIDFASAKGFVDYLSDNTQKKYQLVKWKHYWKNISNSSFEGKNKIIVATLEGEIGNKKDLNCKRVHRMFKDIIKNEEIKGVVLKINSPGGDVFESDMIHHEISELSKKLPVVVYFGDYAASGGYYISVAADTIVSSPYCLTGSIGIFGAFMKAKKLADKLGFSYESVKTQLYADAGNIMKDITNEERKLVTDYIDRGYENFLGLVAKGRNKTRDEVDKIARGRIWLGLTAKEIGLVDEVGGLDVAIEKAVQKAHIDNYKVNFLTKNNSLGNYIWGKDEYTVVSLKQTALNFIFGRNAVVDELKNSFEVFENSEQGPQIYAYCPFRMEI